MEAIRQDRRHGRCRGDLLSVAATGIRQRPLVALRRELPLALLAFRHKEFLVSEVKVCLASLQNVTAFRADPSPIAVLQPHRFASFSIAAFRVRQYPNRRKLS